jgi:CheY-like chemotaxis protein
MRKMPWGIMAGSIPACSCSLTRSSLGDDLKLEIRNLAFTIVRFSRPAPIRLECPRSGHLDNTAQGRAVPRILVVDDQTHVRAAIVLALQRKGFDVVAAESGQSGLTKFAQSDFDVVIADLFMPGIDGVTLIKALRKRNPRFPVIAMSGVLLGTSGRTALDHLPNISELSDVICLQKPFRPNDLLQAVAAALAGSASPAGPAHPIPQCSTPSSSTS